LSNIQAELASLKQQIEQSKRPARASSCKRKKRRLKKHLRTSNGQLDELKRQLQDEEKQLAVELEATIARIKQAANQQVEHIRQDITALNSQEQQALQQLEQQRLNQPESRQIDVDALQQLEARIKALKKQLDTAKVAGETVNDYRRWEQLHWSGYADMCNAIRERIGPAASNRGTV